MQRILLVETDPQLDEAKKPTSAVEEFDGYVWSLSEGKANKDEPVKQDDHGLDALRYGCMYADNPRDTGGIYV